MIIFKTVADLQQHLQKLRYQQKTIGFAPTMGALHPGHLSLVQACKKSCDISVVSIFVNPTQFNDPKDFEKYPVTIENDCRLLEEEKTDILLLPSVKEMYPEGLVSKAYFELGSLETVLEGRYRPGHFQGVCQVVSRLLNIVQPDRLFLGQKDFQQCMVLQKLVQLMQIPTQISIVPTMREADGLAMSSRNVRLDAEQRQKATAIYRELKNIEKNFGRTDTGELKKLAQANLLTAGFGKIDYVGIAATGTLLPLENAQPATKAVALVAAFMGEVRLIDNLLLN